MDRRSFLRTGIASSAVGLAGCPQGGSDETATETDHEETTVESEQGGLPRLQTDGSWIVTENGEKFTPRGINLVEPLFADQNAHKRGANYVEHLELATNTDEAWYNTILRVPVNQWGIDQIGIEEYATRFLDPTVDHCREAGVYLILDYHIIEDWQDEAVHAQVETFWDFFASRYADESHVLYELYNEPQKPAANSLANWNAWKEVAQPWVDRVRKDAPDTPLIVGSPNWTSLTKWAAESPFEGDTLIYAGHIYPGDGKTADEWEAEYGAPADEVPVMITEFGWDATDDVQPGTTSEWGDPFREWLDDRENVGWTAWCFDSHWAPTMVDFDFNTKGGDLFHGWSIKEWLFDQRESHVPETIRRAGAEFQGPSDDTPPEPPANVAFEPSESTGVFSWDQSADEDTRVVHYDVYVDGNRQVREKSLILLNEAEGNGADDAWETTDLRFETTLEGFFPGNEYEMYATAVDSLSNESERSELLTYNREGDVPNDVSIPKVDSPPTIDGAVDDVWSDSSSNGFENTIQGSVESESDLGGGWRAYWDTEALYLLVDVSDEKLVRDSDTVWQDDCIEVYVDGDNSKNQSYDGDDDFQIQFPLNAGADEVSGNVPSDVGDDFAWAETDDGYRFEAALPWSAIAPDESIEAGYLLGIDVHVNDDDDGDGRDGKVSWHNSSDDSWQHPSTFAFAELVE